MKRNIFRFIKYSLIVFLVIFLYKIFWPRSYNVPEPQLRGGTNFWNLSTGSTIGYTFIRALGNKKDFPIIYLHGGPGGFVSDRDIRTLSTLAEDGYDIYLYDQIGSGQSARLENINDYTVDRHVKDLKEIVSKVGAEKVILIGQSWGAVLATFFTADNSEKVEKIILTSPGPIYPVHQELKNVTPPDSFHLRTPFYSNNQGNEKANNWRIKTIALWATKFHQKLAADKEVDDFATCLNFEVNKSTVCDTAKIIKAEAGSGFYAAVMTFKNLGQVQDPRPKLKNSTLPALVMKGQCDNQKWGFTNEYLVLFRNHQFAFIPDAGHFISVEQPESYIKSIKGFLSK
ncbi:MAG: alpha/beta hydrolase [Sphingobacteriia bacterium]|nr:MAG: alpha/beta hydrolase [Sphingobacteriia bacterium]